MKQRVLLVGVPGVGKTAVIEEFKRLADEEKLQYKIMNFGTVMLEIAKDTIKDRDEIRRAPIEVQHKLQRRVAEVIAQEWSGGVLIVDTHVIIKTRSGYLPGIPYHVLQGLKPDLIALVEASPEEISFRRSKDASRRREVSSTKEVEDDLQFSRAIAFTCATLAGIPLGIVLNKAGDQRAAAMQLLGMIKD